jgi:hypothetical protein
MHTVTGTWSWARSNPPSPVGEPNTQKTSYASSPTSSSAAVLNERRPTSARISVATKHATCSSTAQHFGRCCDYWGKRSTTTKQVIFGEWLACIIDEFHCYRCNINWLIDYLESSSLTFGLLRLRLCCTERICAGAYC